MNPNQARRSTTAASASATPAMSSHDPLLGHVTDPQSPSAAAAAVVPATVLFEDYMKEEEMDGSDGTFGWSWLSARLTAVCLIQFPCV